MDIVIYPDKRLSTPAKVVENIDDSLQNLIDEMMKTIVEHVALGLAAPQVGKSKRLFIYRCQDLPIVLINPAIKQIDDAGFDTQEEACLSLVGLQVHIARASKIKVSGLDREGTEQRFEAKDMLARIIQHETDHLNGVLLIDHASRQIRRAYNRKLRKIIK